ncbi:hypothetical protein NN6n1_41950 [Shinella zoogloeoides]
MNDGPPVILSTLFGGLFGGGASTFTPTTTLGNYLQGIPGFAAGTNFAPGGPAIVGERGPELVNLPRGSQVIPNNRLPATGGAMQSGGDVHVSIPITIDATGADAAGLARVERQLATLEATLPNRIVSTVQEAQKRRGL